jgi:hypothetical protein
LIQANIGYPKYTTIACLGCHTGVVNGQRVMNVSDLQIQLLVNLFLHHKLSSGKKTRINNLIVLYDLQKILKVLILVLLRQVIKSYQYLMKLFIEFFKIILTR